MKIPRLAILTVAVLLSTLSVHAQQPPTLLAKGSTPIGWKEFFPDFPAMRMGMSFKAAKSVIKKAGLRAITLPQYTEELAWNTTFAGIEGRATMLFRPKTGAWEIAVVVYAMEEQAALVKKWREKIELRHGPPTEIHDDEYAVSYVWRFKSGNALELRSPKDVNSPVVDIHWVKSIGSS